MVGERSERHHRKVPKRPLNIIAPRSHKKKIVPTYIDTIPFMVIYAARRQGALWIP